VPACKISSKSAKRFRDYDFFGFSRWRSSAILDLEIFKFLVDILGDLNCIAIPNFTKIGQTVAEISHLKTFKMAAVRHLGILKV